MVAEGGEAIHKVGQRRGCIIPMCSLMLTPRIGAKNRGCGVPLFLMVHEIQLLLGGWNHFGAYLCVQKNCMSLELFLFENITIQVLWDAVVFFFGLVENKYCVLWLGLGLSVVSLINKIM